MSEAVKIAKEELAKIRYQLEYGALNPGMTKILSTRETWLSEVVRLAEKQLQAQETLTWISVAEQPPEVGEWILVWNSVMGFGIDKLNEDKRWALTNDPITHWAHLPNDPKMIPSEEMPNLCPLEKEG